MLSHRIDYAHTLSGYSSESSPTFALVPMRDNQPADVDDWVAMIGS
jgi:hypothetical protein